MNRERYSLGHMLVLLVALEVWELKQAFMSGDKTWALRYFQLLITYGALGVIAGMIGLLLVGKDRLVDRIARATCAGYFLWYALLFLFVLSRK